MSSNLSRPSWKKCAFLLILLSHAVFGSPTIPAVRSANEFSEPTFEVDIPGAESLHDSLEENVFGPTSNERSDRKKRFLYDKLKKAKQAKLLSLGAASSSAAKKIGKSVLKTVATLGVKAIIFNFLFSKINQVLDFKTRLLNNLEHKNREQNSQVLGTGDSSTADSNINTTTELPAEVEISTFDPNKISLNVPSSFFATGFSVASSTATIIETLVQNTALRIARLLDALKAMLRTSSNLKSKKREALDVSGFVNSTASSVEVTQTEEQPEKTSIKDNFVAPT